MDFMEEVVKVSSRSQVVIPARISRRLKIAKGTRMVVRDRGGSVIMKPMPKLSDLVGIDRGLHLSKELKRMREEDAKLDSAD